MPSSLYSKSNKSLSLSKLRESLNENELQRIQRDVDTYTRDLEQEKRRLFSVEETYNIVAKEYKERLKVIEKIKAPANIKSGQVSVHTKSLQNQLEQAIVKYNEILAVNKKLRLEVDVIRRERVSLEGVRENMTEEIERAKQRLFELKNRGHQRSGLAIELQHKIVALRDKNEEEQSVYINEYRNLQSELREEKKKISILTNKGKMRERPENFDTLTMLRRRLQRIIFNNREKVKVIDQYQKNMRIIDEAFNIIKETSGITDIEEIQNTFIKSEEQNYSLFNYVNVLTQDIDFLEENNKDLENEIKDMEYKLELRQKLSEQTPPDEIERRRVLNMIHEKDNFVKDVRGKLTDIKDPLQEVLQALGGGKFSPSQPMILYDDFIFNENTVEQYLSLLEGSVNRMLPFISKVNQNKEFLTAGLLLDDIPTKDFEKSHRSLGANFFKESGITEESTHESTIPINEQQLREYAKGSIERLKYQIKDPVVSPENGRHHRERLNTRVRPDLTEKY